MQLHACIVSDMKSTVTCERQIDVLDNGVINQPPGNDPLGVGQRIWYTCNDYYRLEGAQDVTCLSSGDWSNPPPHCVRKLNRLINCDQELLFVVLQLY